MTMIFFVSYIGLTALAGFAKGFLALKVIGAVNVGFMLIAGNYALAWLLAAPVRSGAPKKFSGQLLTAKHRQKFSFSRQTHSNYLILLEYLLNRSKVTHSMALPLPKIRSHRNAIEMAANEDGSQWTRDKRPRSATQFGAQCGLNSA
jgi:uncharacterized membrane protein (DUF485 family)